MSGRSGDDCLKNVTFLLHHGITGPVHHVTFHGFIPVVNVQVCPIRRILEIDRTGGVTIILRSPATAFRFVNIGVAISQNGQVAGLDTVPIVENDFGGITGDGGSKDIVRTAGHLFTGPFDHLLVVLAPIIDIDLCPFGSAVVKVQGQLARIVDRPTCIEAAETVKHIVGRHRQVHGLDTLAGGILAAIEQHILGIGRKLKGIDGILVDAVGSIHQGHSLTGPWDHRGIGQGPIVGIDVFPTSGILEVNRLIQVCHIIVGGGIAQHQGTVAVFHQREGQRHTAGNVQLVCPVTQGVGVIQIRGSNTGAGIAIGHEIACIAGGLHEDITVRLEVHGQFSVFELILTHVFIVALTAVVCAVNIAHQVVIQTLLSTLGTFILVVDMAHIGAAHITVTGGIMAGAVEGHLGCCCRQSDRIDVVALIGHGNAGPTVSIVNVSIQPLPFGGSIVIVDRPVLLSCIGIIVGPLGAIEQIIAVYRDLQVVGLAGAIVKDDLSSISRNLQEIDSVAVALHGCAGPCFGKDFCFSVHIGIGVSVHLSPGSGGVVKVDDMVFLIFEVIIFPPTSTIEQITAIRRNHKFLRLVGSVAEDNFATPLRDLDGIYTFTVVDHPSAGLLPHQSGTVVSTDVGIDLIPLGNRVVEVNRSLVSEPFGITEQIVAIGGNIQRISLVRMLTDSTGGIAELSDNRQRPDHLTVLSDRHHEGSRIKGIGTADDFKAGSLEGEVGQLAVFGDPDGGHGVAAELCVVLSLICLVGTIVRRLIHTLHQNAAAFTGTTLDGIETRSIDDTFKVIFIVHNRGGQNSDLLVHLHFLGDIHGITSGGGAVGRAHSTGCCAFMDGHRNINGILLVHKACGLKVQLIIDVLARVFEGTVAAFDGVHIVAFFINNRLERNTVVVPQCSVGDILQIGGLRLGHTHNGIAGLQIGHCDIVVGSDAVFTGQLRLQAVVQNHSIIIHIRNIDRQRNHTVVILIDLAVIVEIIRLTVTVGIPEQLDKEQLGPRLQIIDSHAGIVLPNNDIREVIGGAVLAAGSHTDLAGSVSPGTDGNRSGGGVFQPLHQICAGKIYLVVFLCFQIAGPLVNMLCITDQTDLMGICRVQNQLRVHSRVGSGKHDVIEFFRCHLFLRHPIVDASDGNGGMAPQAVAGEQLVVRVLLTAVQRIDFPQELFELLIGLLALKADALGDLLGHRFIFVTIHLDDQIGCL